MRTLLGVVSSSLLMLGCAAPKVTVLPALTPVDASRPFFVYKPVKGTGCGKDAAASAMADLYRIAGDAHGFVSAVIEQEQGGTQCVSITARPITYGCVPAEPQRLDVTPMHVLPGPAGCAPVVDACAPDCTRFADALAGAEFEAKAVRERCVSRCRAADTAFMTCARGATAPSDVRRCDALP